MDHPLGSGYLDSLALQDPSLNEQMMYDLMFSSPSGQMGDMYLDPSLSHYTHQGGDGRDQHMLVNNPYVQSQHAMETTMFGGPPFTTGSLETSNSQFPQHPASTQDLASSSKSSSCDASLERCNSQCPDHTVCMQQCGIPDCDTPECNTPGCSSCSQPCENDDCEGSDVCDEPCTLPCFTEHCCSQEPGASNSVTNQPPSSSAEVRSTDQALLIDPTLVSQVPPQHAIQEEPLTGPAHGQEQIPTPTDSNSQLSDIPGNQASASGAIQSTTSRVTQSRTSQGIIQDGHMSHPGHQMPQQPYLQDLQGYSAAPPSLPCYWNGYCPEVYPDTNSLGSHIVQDHVMDRSFTVPCQWDNCGMLTSSLDILNHIQTAHNLQNNPSVCHWTGCSSSEDLSTPQLLDHVSSNHIFPQDIACEWKNCGVHLHDPQYLWSHLQTHLPTGIPANSVVPFHQIPTPITSVSEKSSSVQPEVSLRCQWMSDLGNGEIRGCTFIASSSNELHKHLVDCHLVSSNGSHLCRWPGCKRYCEGDFKQRSKLERHLQVHSGYKACQCPYCGEFFSASQSLKQHIRTHTGEKPFQCRYCPKTFKQGSAKTMHERTHDGSKPLTCDYPGCGKSFAESSNLSKHRRTHMADQFCKCDRCGKTFARQDQLRRHMKTHLRAAPKQYTGATRVQASH